MRLAARPTLFPRATLSGLAAAEVSCAQIHPMIGCFFRDHSPQALPGGHRPGADPPAHRRRPLAARPAPAAGAGTRRAARHEPQHRARSGARADLLRRAGSPPGRRHLRARLRRSAGNHAGAGAQRGAALPGGTRDDRDRGGAPGCRSPRRQRPGAHCASISTLRASATAATTCRTISSTTSASTNGWSMPPTIRCSANSTATSRRSSGPRWNAPWPTHKGPSPASSCTSNCSTP
ncbi:Uncharacterised protein [Pseudomonas aeruginosa]|nr:Uncharacterised protein [Pseudomonas aeruginosa]